MTERTNRHRRRHRTAPPSHLLLTKEAFLTSHTQLLSLIETLRQTILHQGETITDLVSRVDRLTDSVEGLDPIQPPPASQGKQKAPQNLVPPPPPPPARTRSFATAAKRPSPP